MKIDKYSFYVQQKKVMMYDKKSPKIFQFKIQLNDIKPVIWRRIQVLSTITFAEFHDIIQYTMGWHQCHLREFIVQGMFGRQGIGPIFDDGFDCPIDENTINLNTIFRA